MNLFDLNFLGESFNNIFLIALASNIVVFVLIVYFTRNRRIRFPDKSTVNVLFEEGWVSGRSHKNFITKLGGGRNCIKVTVTDEELWINTPFPFNVIAYFYDGIQRIPLKTIRKSEILGDTVLVEYDRKDGELGMYELKLKNKDNFINTIKSKS